MPTGGQATSQEEQDELTVVLQAAAAANGNGVTADFTGYSGAATLELNNAGTGTCTGNLEGSFDQTTWYAAGYMQIDGQSNPVRSAAAIAVTAGPFAHVYSVLDNYNFYRCRISAAAGAPALTATLRGVPL